MSVRYAEVDPYAPASSTGAAVYSSLPDIEATQRHTGLSISGIGNPALRQALEVFERALCRDLGRLGARITFPRSSVVSGTEARQRSNEARLPEFYQANLLEYHQADKYWLPTTYAVPHGYLNVVSTGEPLGVCLYEIPTQLPSGLIFNLAGVGVSTFAYASSIGVVADSVLAGSDLLAPAGPPAVSAVEDIADWFGVSIAVALNASGIAKRTYQAWKHAGTRRPRASSEGRLWELHQLAEDLVETKGLPGLRHWFNEDPARRELLRAGAIHELASQAYAGAKTDARPAWVGVGNLETYETPQRDVTLRPMDPGDVVEPG